MIGGYPSGMKPLEGVRIIEFDGLGPVTFAGMVLADMGAEVLRLTRSAAAAAAVFSDVGGEVLHRGRRAVPADLKDPADRSCILELAQSADIVIEGFRPGVMERLGLGPEVLQAANPRLVYGRVTGWGQYGPLANQVGHDLNYIALSGALHPMGDPNLPPRPPLNLVGDYAGGSMFLVAGVLAALLDVRSGGPGRVVDTAMTDGSALLTGLFHGLKSRGLWSESRGGNLLDGGAPFYRCYRCRDGRFVAVGALEPRFYAALIAGLGVAGEDAPQHDRSRWPELHLKFEALFAARDRDEWEEIFLGTEACVTPVLSLAEAPEHPHNAARGSFFGTEPVQPAPAPRFQAGPPATPAAAGSISLADALKGWT
jgi:alpha-methylacyl-CoA racemase